MYGRDQRSCTARVLCLQNLALLLCLKTVLRSQVGWHTPLSPAVRRKSLGDLWIRGQLVLRSEFKPTRAGRDSKTLSLEKQQQQKSRCFIACGKYIIWKSWAVILIVLGTGNWRSSQMCLAPPACAVWHLGGLWSARPGPVAQGGVKWRSDTC